MTIMPTSTKPLPKHLHAVYDWTAAAGELEELAGLHDRRLASYARESEANARQNDVTDVHASDIKELAAWLQLTKHRATKKKSPAQLEREIAEALAGGACEHCKGTGAIPVPTDEPGRFGKATHLVCAHCGGSKKK